MIEIIEENRRPRADVGTALRGLVGAAGQFQQQRQQKQAISDLLGEQYANLPPEFQQLGLQSKLRQQEMGQKLQGESEVEGRDYDVVKNTFGPKFADLWRSQPVGARTELIKNAIDATQRGIDLEKTLNGVKPVEQIEEDDLYAGLTPKERAKKKSEIEKLHRHEQTELSKPVLLEMNQIRKNIPLQEQAILDIQEAAPNVSALDYFADVTGFEPLRSAEGAKLKTGIKDFFLSDLTRVGARPNQWIEQQLADALPKIGRSAEANLITAEGLKFKLDLAKRRVETIDSLAEKDREKFGFVKGDIDSRAYNDMKKYVIDRQKDLQDEIKKIKAKHKGKKSVLKMTSPEGSIYEIESDDFDEAVKHGFRLSE